MRKPKKPEMKKPETIADLKIEWTFRKFGNMIEGVSEFERLNPELIDLRIKTNRNYIFLIDDRTFIFDSVQYYGPEDNVSIGSFIEAVSWKMRITNSAQTNLKLDRFELVSEDTFRIHTKSLEL